jgi:hypothetical protein
MKKLHLSLAAVLILSTSFYFLSCKKEAAAMLVPAIQKIREAANSEWKVTDKSMLEMNVTLSQKIKDEYQDYATDSNIVVVCRVKFKDQAEERLLPYAIPGLGGTKYYFYTLNSGKLKIHFINSQVSDFTIGGTGSALPIESVSMNFSKIKY